MTFTPNHIYVPPVYLATVGSKRCFTGMSPTFTVREVAHQMRVVEPAIVLVHETLLHTGISAANEANVPLDRLFVFADTSDIRNPVDTVSDWRKILAPVDESVSWSWDPLHGDVATTTVAVVNFSSGTTGLPKGVCITHHNLVANCVQAIFCRFQNMPNALDYQSSELWLAFLPLYHAYSQLFTISIALKLQITVYIMTKFSFESLLKYVQDYRITTIQAVPPLLLMMAKRPETAKYDIRSLDYILSGGAPLAKELQIETMTRFDLVVAQGFGMSETTCCAFITPGMTKDLTGSIGNLLPNTEACLLNEHNEEVSVEGEPGGLCLRGPQMMLGYWENDEANKQTISSLGWMRTGDVAVVKGNKWWIVDRRKELIKVNGLQVAPAELEAVLLEHNGIADAAVVGITINGEEFPRAYIVLQPTNRGAIEEDDVQEFVSRRVSRHKRLIGSVKFVETIPKLASGKIVRKIIKDWARQDAKAIEGRRPSPAIELHHRRLCILE